MEKAFIELKLFQVMHLLPNRLDTRNGPFAQPRDLLPRTEEVVLLIETAVCGKPHVWWCERAGEIKPSRSTRFVFQAVFILLRGLI